MKMCPFGGAGLIGVFGLCCLGGGGGWAQTVPKLAGSLDASFFSIRGADPIWDQEPTVRKVRVQADGAVLISGRFDQIQGWNRVSLGRVLPNGSLDRTFVPPPVLTGYNFARDLVLEPDGKIVVAANASGLLRLDTTGNLDPDFDGQLTNGASAVVRLPSGEYLVSTYVEPVSTEAGYGVVLMDTHGRPSTRWSTEYRSAKAISFLLLSPDGRTVVVDGVAALSLEQVGANVRHLTNSLPTDFWPRCGVFQPDGKLLLGSSSGAAPGFYNTNASVARPVVRLTAELAPDLSFSDQLSIGLGPLEGARDQLRVDAVTVEPGGKIMMAGFFTQVNSEPRPLLARLLPDGELDPEFQPDLEVNPGADIDVLQMISAMALAADNHLVIGGLFSRINGLPCSTLARLHTQAESSGGILCFDQPAYYAWETNGSIAVAVNRLGPTNHQVSVYYEAPDLTPDTQVPAPQRGLLVFGPGEVKKTVSLVVRDNRFLDGNHSFHLRLSNPHGGAVLTGTPETRITIYDDELPGRPGSVDLSFPQIEVPGALYGFGLLAVEPDGSVLLTTSFPAEFGVSQLRVLRCHSNGVIDPEFHPTIDGYLVAAFPDPATGKILMVGNFSSVNNPGRANLARLNHDGSLDESFPAISISPQWLVGALFQPDDGTMVLYGPFTSVNNLQRRGVVRLLGDGSVDPRFDTSTASWIRSLDAVAAQPGGKLILAGNFNTDGQILARLNSDGSRDASFVPPGFRLNWGVNSLQCQPDGKVLVGGSLQLADGRNAKLIRLSSDGSLDPVFWADVPGSFYGSSVILQPDGKILVGGTWRLNQDGSRDHSFFTGERSDDVSQALLLADGNLMVSGGFSEFAGWPRSQLARLNGGDVPVFGFFDFPESVLTVPESAGVANLRIRRGGMTNDPATVECRTVDGTARAGTDYQPTVARLTFAPGELEKAVTISMVNDTAYRGNRTFEVDLEDLTTGTRSLSAGPALVTIVEGDPGLTFSRTNSWVYSSMLSTNGLPYPLESLQRHGDLSVPLTVQCQVSAGTAVPGVDFVPTNLTLVFPAGYYEVLVPLPMIRNDEADSDRSVVLTLSSPNPAVSLASDCVATLTVLGPATLPPRLLPETTTVDGHGCFRASCYLRPGQQMGIEASDNLVDWTSLTWVYLDPNLGLSPVSFQDPDAWKYPVRYYCMPIYTGPLD